MCQNRIHISRLAVEVNRQDGLCSLGYRAFDLGHIDGERTRLDVNKYRPGAGIHESPQL